MKNTKPAAVSKAWESGFKAGEAGNADASPPYIIAPTTDHLVQAWREGHVAGLQHYSQQIERERLEKVKRVDAMRGPR
jgi:ribosome modulation factor